MRVFITGASGFVGSAVVDAIVPRGWAVHALTQNRPIDRPGVTSFPGGLFDDAAMDAGMAGCDAVVHLVGIIAEKPRKGVTFQRIHVEGTRRVLAAMGRAGVKRIVHMSALGARPGAVARYHQTKYAAENLVRESGLSWTIFRPSIMHGPDGEFMRQATGWAQGERFPWVGMPYFGRGLLGRGGSGLVQPVFVDDVAAAICDSLPDDRMIGEVFPVGGPNRMTWPGMYDVISRAVAGRPARLLAVPAWYAKAIAAVVPGLPFSRDQVLMSQEDNVCDNDKFVAFFGRTPVAMVETINKRV